MDVFQSDEFRAARVAPPPPAPAAPATHPYTLGLLAALVALGGGAAVWGLTGTDAFGWALAAWLLLLAVLLARLAVDLAVRRRA